LFLIGLALFRKKVPFSNEIFFSVQMSIKKTYSCYTEVPPSNKATTSTVKKSGLIREVFSLVVDDLLEFYYLSASG
jgi:hypothetical protein